MGGRSRRSGLRAAVRGGVVGMVLLSGSCVRAPDLTWNDEMTIAPPDAQGNVQLSFGTLSAATATRVGDLVYTPLPHDHQRLLQRCAGTGCLEHGPEALALAVAALGGWSTEGHFSTPRVVSVLKFYARGSYTPLGLISFAKNAEYNVELQQSGGVWTGSLVNVANSSEIIPLQVARKQYTNPKPPPTTRFMRNAAGEVGIGVQCADGWCILSRDEWVEPTSKVNCTGMPATCGVPGFSDEQELAKCWSAIYCLSPVSIPGLDFLERSQVVGGFYPIDTLARVTDAGLEQGYATVAYARSVTGVYKKGRVRIRDATVATATFQLRMNGMDGDHPRYNLRVISVSDGGVPDTSEYAKVDLKPHPEIFDHGTARWAWNPRDEGLWIRCPAGCCQVKKL